MSIKVKIKNIYGRDLVYPVCEKAKLLAKLVQQATFTSREIQVIKDLGYSIEVVQDTKEL